MTLVVDRVEIMDGWPHSTLCLARQWMHVWRQFGGAFGKVTSAPEVVSLLH